jgi:predicted ATPase
MLTRLYIDNFRCFVNFEYRPGRKELIMGGNGTGKSSLLDALLFARQFVAAGVPFEDSFILSQRTRWTNQPTQTLELDADLGNGVYTYRLVLDACDDPPRPRVLNESVNLEGRPIFGFAEGEVHLYNDSFEQTVSYPFDWHRSALATVVSRKENQKLIAFKRWLARVYCFRINPFRITSKADGEQLYPNVDLSNFASWYRHLHQSNPRQNEALMNDLRSVLEGFRYLLSEPAGESVRLWIAEFETAGGKTSRFYFNELSEGQRCLICLYAVVRFVLSEGGTVLFDEPDNFIALRELQPWLSVVSDALEDHGGQALIVSHHPEFLNQWAPSHGVMLVREIGGPVHVERFQAPSNMTLTPAELIARGWER